MSLTFYYAPMSTASITEIILDELGVPHEKVKLDLTKGDTQKPDFLKLNPNGKVPLIVHDGTAIWESAAITLYLGETFGVEKKLYPPPGPQRGEAMRWIVWSNVSLGHATAQWLHAKDAEKDAAKGALDKLLGILDGALANRPFLAGDYSLADTHLNSFVDWLRFSKVDLSPYANLAAWCARCQARPAYAKWFAAAMAAMQNKPS